MTTTTNKDQVVQLNSLVDDTKEDGISYVTPSIETKLPKQKKDEVHAIVKEIRDFGIGQRQILYLIYQLALGLESREALVAITSAVNGTRDSVNAPTLYETPKHKLIIETE